MGRFLNADAYASTGQGILGNNMFAYCLNNPTNYSDSCGCICREFDANKYDPSWGTGTGGIPIIPLKGIGEVLAAAEEWIETEKKAIVDKLTQSLAAAKTREYRSEYEIHHMTARMSPNAAKAAEILNVVLPGGVEDPLNLVPVKTSVHKRIHTKLYYNFVNQLLINAYYQANENTQQQYINVITTLAQIRIFIESLNAYSIN